MSISLANSYYIKALDNYDYDAEQTIEALNYALSYDEEHAGVHCLMGRLQMDQLKNFEAAAFHFRKALYFDKNYVDIYLYYSKLLIKLNEIKKAKTLIKTGLAIKGMDKAILFSRIAFIAERKGKYNKAIKFYRKALKHSYNQSYFQHYKEEISRVESKLEDLKQFKYV